jgi:hypothetical protein
MKNKITPVHLPRRIVGVELVYDAATQSFRPDRHFHVEGAYETAKEIRLPNGRRLPNSNESEHWRGPTVKNSIYGGRRRVDYYALGAWRRSDAYKALCSA